MIMRLRHGLEVLCLLWCLALASLCLSSCLSPAGAQGLNPEDEPISDVIPAVPAPAKTLIKAKPSVKVAPTKGPAKPRTSAPGKQPSKPVITPETKPTPTTLKPAVRPSANPPAANPPAASPTPASGRAPGATPVNPEDQPIEYQPIEDAPIEDQPIPDTPVTEQDIGAAPSLSATPTAAAKPPPAAQGKHEAAAADIVDSPPPIVQETGEDAPERQSDINPWSLRATFQQDFMRHALIAGIIMALLCSYLGIYVVLKRIVFVGVALAEVSSTGIALAILLGFAPLLGAMGFMLLGVTLLSIHWSPRRVPHESYIGIIYAVAAALSVLFLAKSPTGETHMLKLLQGDVLTVSMAETWQMVFAFAVVALLHALFSKEFLIVSFDRDAASTLGFRAAAWNYLLFLTIGVTIAFSIRTAGVLVASTMLILPAATALLVTHHLRRAWLLAPLLGALPVVAGLHFSFVWDLPSSALIVLLSFLLLLPALAWHAVKRRA
ncbi:MAG TPA: metal ABC transporter permease [Abditibacteriaceae bacterium]|nr:metal ABC transporter permease [Abditibacteriaceae bacterium]